MLPCSEMSTCDAIKLMLGHSTPGVAGSIGSKLVSGSMSISPASRSNVQYNPAGDTKSKIKTSSLEIGFLGKRSTQCIRVLRAFFGLEELQYVGWGIAKRV